MAHTLGVPCPSGPFRSGPTAGTLHGVRGARLRLLVAVVACATALSACTSSDGSSEGGGSSPENPAGEPGAAAPFDLTVERITVVGMDNAAILGVAGRPASNEAAELAVAAARRALATFLNAQLLDEGTRFSAAPVDGLLSARARAVVSPEDRAGLGQVAVPVTRAITGPASTVAQVLLDGETAHAVTLNYSALLTVELQDGTQSPVKQSGAMTFVPTDEGWRADAVEVRTELPEVTS